MIKAPKPLKKFLHKSGLRKPIGMLVSPEFREIARLTKEMKADFHRRGFEKVYRAHINGTDGYKKYLDLDHALEPAIKWAQHLGLFRSPPLRIFDVGCGPGYFLHVARQYGGLTVSGSTFKATPSSKTL